MDEQLILGAGPTGLGLGLTTGWPILEAQPVAGGICRSYYLDRSGRRADSAEKACQDVYRFEHGGGHWLFHLDDHSTKLLKEYASLDFYTRDSAVYFPQVNALVPYPLQDHLDSLPQQLQPHSAHSQSEFGSNSAPVTMQDWLLQRFGSDLCQLFFFPFHDRYTCGLYRDIAPQDAYKSPNPGGRQGGYNLQFAYPREGLDRLFECSASRCNVRYGHRVARIDTDRHALTFANGSELRYGMLYSTLPLSTMVKLTGLNARVPEDPHISVHVVNVGATKGTRCPRHHWLYIPQSDSGFHRVGFYSNVSNRFLPQSVRAADTHVSIYVERCFLEDSHPTPREMSDYTNNVVSELRQWGFIDFVEVIDSTWVDVGYTWSWPRSTWRDEAIARLREVNIRQLGRYGRWAFQGIVDSLQEGMACGREMQS